MYATVVERIVRKGFAALSEGNATPALQLFADDARLTFPGCHALAAACQGKAEITEWFDRLLRTLPGIRFELHDVLVRGMPWSTRVLTRFTDFVPLADGSTIRNEGVQFLRIRWGKVVEDTLYLDTQIVADAVTRATR